MLAFGRVQTISHRRALIWLGLGSILILYVVSVAQLHPTNFFGFVEDDSIYFSSAKALTEGKGYILPSLPGSPPATKYPILYPWILSWVWRWNPSFPANLTEAVGVNVAFGLVYLAMAFMFLRRLKGIGDAEALLLTALCALQPLVLFYSGSLLTEIPFSALALAAMLVANPAMWREANAAAPAFCGVLVGLTMLTRVLGVPIATGIFAAGLLRRAWRQLLIFCACAAPFFAALAWRMVLSRPPAPLVSATDAASLGWPRTWAFYTSYFEFWKISIPNMHFLWAMLKNNAGIFLHGPSDYFLAPLLVRNTPLGNILTTPVTAVMVAGIVRQARGQEWKPIHCALPFYLAILLFWNYPDLDRYFLPFLPLFAAGLWFEGKHVLGMVRRSLANSERVTERVLAASLGLIIIGLSFGIAWNYVRGMANNMAAASEPRAALLQEKREAYDWLSRFTAPNVRVIACEDASVYLYAGRTTMRPIEFTTIEFYEPGRLEEVMAHMTDVARAIRADYWIVADDDFSFEWDVEADRARRRVAEIERVLPLVFRSRKSRVRIYALPCIQRPDDPSCQSADRVLFPADNGGSKP